MIAPTPRAQRMAEFDFQTAYAGMLIAKKRCGFARDRQHAIPALEQIAADAEARFLDMRANLTAEISRLTGLSVDQLREAVA